MTRYLGYAVVMLYLGMGLISLPWKLFATWYRKPKRMDAGELRALQKRIEMKSLSLIKQAKGLKDRKFEIDFNSTFITKRFKNIGFGKNLGVF